MCLEYSSPLVCLALLQENLSILCDSSDSVVVRDRTGVLIHSHMSATVS